MLTLKKVNKEIQKKYPYLILCQGKGYLYFWSDFDCEKSHAVRCLYDTSIAVCRLNHMSLDSWLKESDEINSRVIDMLEEQK